MSDTNSDTKLSQELNQILKTFPGTKSSSSDTKLATLQEFHFESLHLSFCGTSYFINITLAAWF